MPGRCRIGDRSSRISMSSAVYPPAFLAMSTSLEFAGSAPRPRRLARREGQHLSPGLRAETGPQLVDRKFAFALRAAPDRVHQGEKLVESRIAPSGVWDRLVQRRELVPAYLA